MSRYCYTEKFSRAIGNSVIYKRDLGLNVCSSCVVFRQAEPGWPGWFWAGVEVWGGGWEAEGGPEYQPLLAGSGGRDPGPEGAANTHPLQELPPYLLVAGLPGKRQQDSHGSTGMVHSNFISRNAIWNIVLWLWVDRGSVTMNNLYCCTAGLRSSGDPLSQQPLGSRVIRLLGLLNCCLRLY